MGGNHKSLTLKFHRAAVESEQVNMDDDHDDDGASELLRTAVAVDVDLLFAHDLYCSRYC